MTFREGEERFLEKPSGERARVTGLIMACWSTQVIGVAAKLRLFDALAAGPRASSELSGETGSHPGALHRLMRALAVMELVRQTGADRFELTNAGRLLSSDAPGSVRGMALHWGDRLWGALSQLDQSVATGKAWRISGAEGFQHMASDPAQLAMFHQSMADQTAPVVTAVLEAYDFSRFGRIMDVGGSLGALVAGLVKAHPGLKGQVYDLPDLQAAANDYLRKAGAADRATFVGGSFFDEVPPGADAYLMKMIIHDWEDAEAGLILKNCRKALGPGAVVLVMERIVAEIATAADFGAIRGDITMLTAAGGKERTRAEYERLFAGAGLKLQRVIPTSSGFDILEATAA
jgi:hypothetical protein